jgi:hypothetical protein
MSNFAAGHNMPGYLPESDVWITRYHSSAVLSLLDDIERYADSEAELLEDGEETNSTIDAANEAIAELKTLPSGSEYLTYVGDYAYWINLTDEEPEDE